jgi:hypothetical protein
MSLFFDILILIYECIYLYVDDRAYKLLTEECVTLISLYFNRKNSDIPERVLDEMSNRFPEFTICEILPTIALGAKTGVSAFLRASAFNIIGNLVKKFKSFSAYIQETLLNQWSDVASTFDTLQYPEYKSKHLRIVVGTAKTFLSVWSGLLSGSSDIKILHINLRSRSLLEAILKNFSVTKSTHLPPGFSDVILKSFENINLTANKILNCLPVEVVSSSKRVAEPPKSQETKRKKAKAPTGVETIEDIESKFINSQIAQKNTQIEVRKQSESRTLNEDPESSGKSSSDKKKRKKSHDQI